MIAVTVIVEFALAAVTGSAGGSGVGGGAGAGSGVRGGSADRNADSAAPAKITRFWGAALAAGAPERLSVVRRCPKAIVPRIAGIPSWNAR